jgi:hypothetical protein
MHMIRLMVPERLRNRAQALHSALSGGVLTSALDVAFGAAVPQLRRQGLSGDVRLFCRGPADCAAAPARQPQSARGGGSIVLPSKRMPGSRSLREQQRAVEVNNTRHLAEQHGRCHGKGGCHHAADHDGEALRLASRARECGCEAAGLVELDVDGVVLAGKFRKAPKAVGRFIGADQAIARETLRASSAPAGSGCSTSSTPAVAAGAQHGGQHIGRPAFIGIDDEARSGTAARMACRRFHHPACQA